MHASPHFDPAGTYAHTRRAAQAALSCGSSDHRCSEHRTVSDTHRTTISTMLMSGSPAERIRRSESVSDGGVICDGADVCLAVTDSRLEPVTVHRVVTRGCVRRLWLMAPPFCPL